MPVPISAPPKSAALPTVTLTHEAQPAATGGD